MKRPLANSDHTRRDFLAGSAVLLASMALSPSRLDAEQADSTGAQLSQLIADLVVANRILAAEGVVDGYGHVSVRHSSDANRYLIARSVAPALVNADDIMQLDLDSKPAEGNGRTLYSEVFIHGEIYKARPDVKAVVHTHSPELVPFGVTGVPLRPVYLMSAFVGQGIPLFEIRKASGSTNMLVQDAEKGRALAQALGDHPAVLMRGHGAAVVGASLSRAVARSIYLQMNARLQASAMALGGNITYLDPEEARQRDADLETDGYNRAWDLWKRKALGK